MSARSFWRAKLADRIVFLRQQLFFPAIAVGAGLGEGRTVIGQLMGLDAGQQFAAPPHVQDALAQEGAQGALLRRIDVGRRDEVGAQQMRDLFGINPVVLVFAAVNGFEVQGVGQDESQAGFLAGIGQPVPAEHAFGADGQVVAVRRDELEEVGEVIVPDVGVDELAAVPVHDADVHLAGMEINSAVELGGGGVVFHGCSTSWLMGVQWTPVNVMLCGECWYHSPPVAQMITKIQKGLTGSIAAGNAGWPFQFRFAVHGLYSRVAGMCSKVIQPAGHQECLPGAGQARRVAPRFLTAAFPLREWPQCAAAVSELPPGDSLRISQNECCARWWMT